MIRSISSASSRLPPIAPVSVFTSVIPRTDCSKSGVGAGVGAGEASPGPAIGVVGPGLGGPVCSPATIGLGAIEAVATGVSLGPADGLVDGTGVGASATSDAVGCGVCVGAEVGFGVDVGPALGVGAGVGGGSCTDTTR